MGSVTVPQIRKFLRHQMGLKFSRVKKVAYNANSQKSLILRQLFAKQLIQLLVQKKRILNIDESWLNDCQFQQKKWREHGTTNSLPGQQVNPRISLIAGIDTEGESYIAMLQVNNDIEIVKMFLTSIAFKLDQERPQWR